MLHRTFEEKYQFGELGLFEAIALASTQIERFKIPLSTAIISPPGEAKTQMLKDVLSLSPVSTYVLVDGVITEYHIAKEKAYEDLNFRLLCINDIEGIIKTS
jgi:hypothetical protein